jgi:dTDP-4-dehydrorhamnose 3,5-epimerase
LRYTVTKSALEGVLLVDAEFFRDERGFFIESWHRRNFADLGIDVDFVQDNHSSSLQGVLRGLHYQDMTAPMGKLVRCTAGGVLDVVVDLRVGSPTFARWAAEELSDENMRQLWCPPGFGHGFLTLSESAEVQYKCSGYYTPSAEGAVAWNDPDLAIEWPISRPQLSKKDEGAPSLRDYLENPAFSYPVRESVGGPP